MGVEDANTSKRIAVISVSTILLVAMVVAVTVGVNVTQFGSKKDKGESRVAPTVKAVKAICHPTDYKKECEESLKAEAGNTTDARGLIKIAFKVTIKRIGAGLKQTDLLQEAEKDPRAKMALDTCKQLMDLSIDELTKSLESMGHFDLNNLDHILASLKVWLSGAITYQETCLDGFENTTSQAGKKMKEVLNTAMQMSSNALSIVSELAKTVSELNVTKNVRRLVEDSHDLPSWVDDGAGAIIRRLLLHTSTGRKLKPDAVVARDGSGKFKSINEALKKVPKKNKKPFVIYIKKGVYKEYVEVTKQMTHVVFVGEGGKRTRITGNKNFVDGVNTYRTPTVAIQGDYFAAINMGFENSAGPHKHQAVAVRVQADKSIFYRCSFDGHQDTLYAHAMRQFYRDCTISGTIDFVFGDAVAVFQSCTFVVRKPMKNQQCIVTAQGRKERHQPSGIVIQGGSIVSDPKYREVRFENKAYLARPWKNYSRAVFMDTYIGDLIQPDGYMPWHGPEGDSGTDTCFYAEFNNTGPGSNKSKRVKWRGIKHLTSKSVSSFLPSTFYHGDAWIKVTGVPYYDSGVTSHKKKKKKQ